MAASTALEFLMLEDGFTDGRGSSDVRLVDQYISGRLDFFVVEILENPRASMDRRSGKVGRCKLQEAGLGNEPAALTILGELHRHEGITFDCGQTVEAGQAVIGHHEIRINEVFHTQVLLK